MFKDCRSLVNRALEKASQYEKEGNTERAEYFLGLAERSEEAYDRKEKGGIDGETTIEEG